MRSWPRSSCWSRPARRLGLSAAVRVVVDRGVKLHTYASLNHTFLLLTSVVAVLAIATAARFYFITKLGERVVADLRKALYDHILTLDQAFFLKTRTGEVLSRITTDMTIVEAMVGTWSSVALRNTLMPHRRPGRADRGHARSTPSMCWCWCRWCWCRCSCSARACAACR